MREQLPLRWDGSAYVEEIEDEAFERLRRIVDAIGVKELGARWDCGHSVISHALARRDGHAWREERTLRLLEEARRTPAALGAARDYVRLLAMLVGLETQERRELTPEERVARLEGAVRSKLGPELAQVLLESAYGK